MHVHGLSLRRGLCAIVGGACGWLTGIASAAPSDPPLTPGSEPVAFQLAHGVPGRHPLALEAGQFVHVEVHEGAARTGLTLLGPAGEPVASREASGESITRLRLLAIARDSGVHTLEVRALSQATPSRYEVRLDPPRAAGDIQGLRASADDALNDAVREANKGTPETRRRALELLDAAEAGFRQADDAIGMALAWHDRGSVQINLGDRAATPSFESSLELFRRAGDPEGQAAALCGLGRVLLRAGDLEPAGAFFEQALALAEAAGNARTIAYYTGNVGVVLARGGRYEGAIERFSRAVALTMEAGDARSQARSLTNFANAHKELGDYDRAGEIYERALDAWQRASPRDGELSTLTNLGNMSLIVGDVERARAYLERALPMAEGTGTDEEGRLLLNLADVHRRGGDHALAIELAERSLALRRRAGQPRGIAASLQVLADCVMDVGEVEKALRYLDEALSLQRSIHDQFLESETLIRMANVESTRGRLHDALRHAEQAVALVETLRTSVTSPELRASFVAVERVKYDTYVDILMRLHEQEAQGGHDAAALAVSERASARVLLDSLVEARADIRAGVDAELLARERELQKRMRDDSARLSGLLARDPAAEEVARARQALAAGATEFKTVQSQIRTRSPRYAALTQPVPPNLEQVRRDALDDDTLLLEYYLGDVRSVLWVVGRTELVTLALPPRRQIEERARRVHELMTERQRTRAGSAVREADARLRTEAASLAQVLLGGVASRLAADWKGRRLLVVAPGALAYVPFGALPLPGAADGRPLLHDHEIVYAPSAAVLIASRREPAGAAAGALTVAVLADPVFEIDDPRVRKRSAGAAVDGRTVGLTRAMRSLGRDRFPRLPFSRGEAAALASLLPARDLLRATDFAASRSLVDDGALSDRRIVHFATHGILDTAHPDLSGLLLSLVDEQGRSRDGFLRMHEIYNLRLEADLVVLSACQTALGREVRGEGLIGLTRGFFYAGARRVLASLWQVDDESTAELMKRFYRAHLRDGQPVGAALRTAQTEMWRDRRWSAPFYWAAFTLQGDWR